MEAAEAAFAAQRTPAEAAAARLGVMRAMLQAQFGPSEWNGDARELSFGAGEGPELRFSIRFTVRTRRGPRRRTAFFPSSRAAHSIACSASKSNSLADAVFLGYLVVCHTAAFDANRAA